MESSSSAIAVGDGCAGKYEEVASSTEQKTEATEQKTEAAISCHAMANGSHDYRFMKNGKRRPSAVRDFPKNVVPVYRISDFSEVKKEAYVPLVPSNDKEEQKQVKTDISAPEDKKRAESSGDGYVGKEEQGSQKTSHSDQQPEKASMPSSKKPQDQSKKKQGLASPNMPQSNKEKDALAGKTQKMPTKLADSKGSTVSSSTPEAESNKGKVLSADRKLKIPAKAGKPAEKKASANASTTLEQEGNLKASKGKDVLLDNKAEKTLLDNKAEKIPLNAAKAVVKKSSGNASSTVLDSSLKKGKDAQDKEKGEKAQKISIKVGKSVEEKANDGASKVLDVSEEAEQEAVTIPQGKTEAMDIDKGEGRVEIEQGKQKKEDFQGEKETQKTKKPLPAKKKPGIRDLPDIPKPKGEKVAEESVQDHSAQDLDMEGGALEEHAADKSKLDTSGKKKRPLAEPVSSDRKKKVSKLKASDVASATKESGSPVATTPPKARAPAKRSSTPSESGKKGRRSLGKSPKPTAIVTDTVEARKLVLESLRLFDAVRRKYVQDEEKTVKTKGTRADLQAASFLKEKNVVRGVEKAQGSFPGIFVGDIFLFRTELSFARVHGPIQAGIDYLTSKESEFKANVAVSIISNVGQDGDDNGEELIYTGQGGRSADNRQIADQKLERGNLALEGNKKFNVPVRLIRGIKDVNSPTGKVYVYDGLYSVEEMFTAKGSGGFNEFKFRLKRMPGQPGLGSEILFRANDLKSKAPSSRSDIVVEDISNGQEGQPICVENTVDADKGGPAPFEYSTKVIYPEDVEKLESAPGCNCKGACSLSSSCSCYCQNGDELPYLNGGCLLRQKDYIFECGSKCSCSSSCRNRLPESRLRFRLEVFKTADRGWGIRSLDVIQAGSLVCEYVGKLITNEEQIKGVSNREHMLFTSRLLDTTPRWGDAPSLFPDRSSSTVRPNVGNPDLIIDTSSVGNVARFINHSCSPNLLMQKVLSDHHDVRYPHFKLFAINNILPMRELTFDYGHPSDQEQVPEELSTECLCGSSDCRRTLYL